MFSTLYTGIAPKRREDEMNATTILQEITHARDGHLHGRTVEILENAADRGNCWYPSSGRDLRDLMWMHPEHLARIGVNVSPPGLFIHTDYERSHWDWLHEETLYSDRVTTITVMERIEMEIDDDLLHDRGRRLGYDGKRFFDRPRGLLLMLRIETDTLPLYSIPLLYLFMENVNFFREVVVKERLPVHAIYRQREGLGFGGCRKSVGFCFAYLGFMQTRIVATDDEIRYRKLGFMYNDPVLQVSFMSPANPPVILEHVHRNKTISDYFPMDWYVVSLSSDTAHRRHQAERNLEMLANPLPH
jgi:hypothetical protein